MGAIKMTFEGLIKLGMCTHIFYNMLWKTPKSIGFQWKKSHFGANFGQCLGPYEKSSFAHFENIFYFFCSQTIKVLEFCKKSGSEHGNLRIFTNFDKKEWSSFSGLHNCMVPGAFLTALRVCFWGLQAQSYISLTSKSNKNDIWGAD